MSDHRTRLAGRGERRHGTLGPPVRDCSGRRTCVRWRTRLGLRPTKQRGQNFVIDANTVRRIVRVAGVGV